MPHVFKIHQYLAKLLTLYMYIQLPNFAFFECGHKKLELCHWRDVYPHMLHWHRIFCMLSHKTREAYLWQFLRIIMPLSFMAILTFEILNSLAWYAIQCLWTKLMWRVILKSHNEWHSYGPDKLIYGHFWPLNSKCDLDLGDIDIILSRNTPSNDG